MKTIMNKVLAGLLAGAALGWSGQARCAGPDWVAVGDAELERARGGFDLGGGLLMSLGVDRTVTVNGNVLSSSAFNIADVSRLTGQEASAAASAAGLNLLQNGAGNTFLAGAMPQALAGTVIQNSLNDQVLRTQTVINASVNSFDLLKMMNFQDSLRTALSNAVGAH
ncbi:MAG TPA: hypothetical protein DCW29_04180 [Janthinobacterium sp.]|nr:hypothetical protein [Janthinobacterium sp.]